MQDHRTTPPTPAPARAPTNPAHELVDLLETLAGAGYPWINFAGTQAYRLRRGHGIGNALNHIEGAAELKAPQRG